MNGCYYFPVVAFFCFCFETTILLPVTISLGDGPICRDTLISFGVIPPILSLVMPSTPVCSKSVPSG